MESKQLIKAEKKLNSALSTFTKAMDDINKAIDLKRVSVIEDEKYLQSLKDKIVELENLCGVVEFGIEAKEAEIKRHIELVARLSEFTL